MNFLEKGFEAIEAGIQTLKDGVSIRDKMGGAMYQNILNDDCLEIAENLVSMGADRKEIGEIGGWKLNC